ncbi:hypothetical protein OAS86_05875, partial [Gammaproteobacteria bacterium]|nr:hypothetical protein [Gammaproteobacteria bacterium]
MHPNVSDYYTEYYIDRVTEYSSYQRSKLVFLKNEVTYSALDSEHIGLDGWIVRDDDLPLPRTLSPRIYFSIDPEFIIPEIFLKLTLLEMPPGTTEIRSVEVNGHLVPSDS